MHIKLTALVLLISLSIINMGGSITSPDTQLVPILTYHHLELDVSSSVAVRPQTFKAQMLALKQAGYQPVTSLELADFLYQGKPLPPNPVMITFDDGYLSNYLYAYPVLKELDYKATIFVVAGECGTTPGTNPHFSWEQAKEMYSSGVIDIQSHSFDSHKSISQQEPWARIFLEPLLTDRLRIGGELESEAAYNTRVSNDLGMSIDLIEKNVGNQVIALSYPYGAHHQALIRLVQKSGFLLGFTIQNGLNAQNADPLQLKRINVSGQDSPEKLLAILR